jgi:Cache domain
MPCFNINQYSTKQQLFGLFGSTTSASCVLIFALLIAYIMVTTNDFEDESRNFLKSDVITYTTSLMNDNADLFIETMNRNTFGFLYPYLNGAENTLETGYNIDDTRGYLEYGDTYLAKPLTYDSRNMKSVSLVHSAYMNQGLLPSNITNLDSSIIDIINKTMNADEYIIPSYSNYKDFVSGYMGFENGGLFMQYPGIGTLTTDPSRTYDPRTRGWYTQAKSASDVIYTDPYKDFNGRGWMITIAKKITKDGVVIGVAGADMLIETIKNNILKIRILGSGKASLFSSSGIVIADQEWAATSSSSQYTYSNLQNPPISSSMWNSITSQNSAIDESNDFMVLSKKFTWSGQYFYLVFTIPKSKMFEPINNITTFIKNSVAATLPSVISVILVALILGLAITFYFANKISDSYDKMGNSADMVVANLGSEDLGKNVNEVNENSGIEEVEKMESGLNKLVKKIKEPSDLPLNQLKGKLAELGMHAIPDVPSRATDSHSIPISTVDPVLATVTSAVASAAVPSFPYPGSSATNITPPSACPMPGNTPNLAYTFSHPEQGYPQ